MKTRYFCENCGSEVKAGAASCPSCGRVFTSVRCPKCGFEGTTSDFKDGCPACGYMVPVQPGAPAAPEKTTGRRTGASGSRLPAGFYTIAAVVLLAVAIVLLAVLFLRS